MTSLYGYSASIYSSIDEGYEIFESINLFYSYSLCHAVPID